LPKTKEIDASANSYKKDDYYILRLDYALEAAANGSWDYCFDHKIEGGSIEITMRDATASIENKYHFQIKPASRLPQNQIIFRITIHSFSSNHASITAGWKYLELLIQRFFHKDDLVQFFGYYQYSNNYSIALKIDDPKLQEEAFWKVLSEITKGTLVRSIQSLQEMSLAYGVDKNTLLKQLKNIKRLGYEIRNQNTNQQIKNGEILIPYSFPSLNERSLQRLTEL